MQLELHEVRQRYAALRRRDPHRERALTASLSEVGQQVPVVVVRDAAAGWVLVDGYKRVRALQRLHQDTVQALAWELGEAEALVVTRLMGAGASDSALEQGWLLAELQGRFGLKLGELARRFDKSDSWVSRRLALVAELPEAVQELVRGGGLSAHAAARHLVPLARAKAGDWQRLASAAATHHLSSRQVGELARLWLVATEQGRQLLASDPLLTLRAHQQRRTKEPSAEEKLLRDISTVGAIARRAVTLAERTVGGGQLGQRVHRAAALAEQETRTLFETLRPEVCDAR
jgi:ParB family chromosome partitioning protein